MGHLIHTISAIELIPLVGDARDCGKWNRENFSEMDFGTDLDLNDKGGLGGGEYRYNFELEVGTPDLGRVRFQERAPCLISNHTEINLI